MGLEFLLVMEKNHLRSAITGPNSGGTLGTHTHLLKDHPVGRGSGVWCGGHRDDGGGVGFVALVWDYERGKIM